MRKFVAFSLAPSGLFDRIILKKKLSEIWETRLREAVECSDNDYLPRVAGAGMVKRGKQIMHNGLLINLGSYYGPEIARLLYENKGVHEPQEERVFAEVLKAIPSNGTMIELGSFWSFYSMWFKQKVDGAKNYMIEPDSFNIESGRRNFALNGMEGDFTRAFVSGHSAKGDPRTICIDDFVKEKGIDFIDILHSDIQGYEYEMLKGAVDTIRSKKIAYVFISTHTNEIHNNCLNFLRKHEFFIIANADLDTTYSQDGIIVGSAPFVDWNEKIPISQKGKPV